MKRNPAANCGNCPYGEIVTPEAVICKVFPDYTWRATEHVCGQHPDFRETVEVTETIPTVWPDTGSLYKLTSVNKKLNAGEMDLLMSDLNTLKSAILAFIEKHDEPKVTINHTAFTSTIKSHKYPEGTE